MTYTTVKCCCCDWKGRTHRYPGHLLAHHLAQIQRVRSTGEHCVYIGIGETDCYVCLTCKKGTTHTGVSRIGDRWAEMHSRQKACRDAHPDVYTRFKTLWTAARGSVIAAEKETAAIELAKADAVMAAKSAGGVGELWTRFRSNRRLTDYMREIEERMKEAHAFDADEEEEPTPFVFDPVDAFERAIAEAMSVRKEVTLTKQKMTEMVVAHNAELTVHRSELIRLGQKTGSLKETVTEQSGRLMENSVEIRDLRTEMGVMREKIKLLEAKLDTPSGKTD
jgi:hypothetical protein